MSIKTLHNPMTISYKVYCVLSIVLKCFLITRKLIMKSNSCFWYFHFFPNMLQLTIIVIYLHVYKTALVYIYMYAQEFDDDLWRDSHSSLITLEPAQPYKISKVSVPMLVASYFWDKQLTYSSIPTLLLAEIG